MCEYVTVFKQSLKALLVALEFYLPIFFRLPVCERVSALLQIECLIICVYTGFARSLKLLESP